MSPEARISGVTVQKMVEKIDYEIILGAKKITTSVPSSSLEWGASGVQILQDFSIGLAPAEPDPGPEAHGGNRGLQDASRVPGEDAGGSSDSWSRSS